MRAFEVVGDVMGDEMDGDVMGSDIAEVVGGEGLTELRHGTCEGIAAVFDEGRADEHTTVEVGEHPLGAGLGAVDGDDPEVFRPDSLDTRGDHAVRFSEMDVFGATGPTDGGACCTHEWVLREVP